ncbi:MAG: rRNA maturation RNase YbeY [Ilumatobacteraceae bacterium]
MAAARFDVLRDEEARGSAELSVLYVAANEMAGAQRNAEHMEVRSDRRSRPDRRPRRDPGGVRHGWRPAGPIASRSILVTPPLLLGDVVIRPSVAAEQAPAHAGTLDDELALLLVHGILHVLGRDHAEADEAAEMRARELALLEAHHWHGARRPPASGSEHDS